MAYRHNISITDTDVEETLLKSQNMSKFVEQCIRFYIQEHETEYSTKEDLEEVKRDIQILNQNYTATKEVLAKIATVLFPK